MCIQMIHTHRDSISRNQPLCSSLNHSPGTHSPPWLRTCPGSHHTQSTDHYSLHSPRALHKPEASVFSALSPSLIPPSHTGSFCSSDTPCTLLVHVLLHVRLCLSLSGALSLIFYVVNPLSRFLKALFECYLLPSSISVTAPSRPDEVPDSMSLPDLSALFLHDTCDICFFEYLLTVTIQHQEQDLDA